ncbi:DNA-binding transcriptional regulator, AcrR family [Leifsonia sp. 21MFCrub1.1]|nr:DNA-binding transcriptional regulator, AcrR family [Leifsonia sp. 21MFCrub1.1]
MTRRRPGRPRKERGEASARTSIMRAAAEEFAERGYEAASLRAVARRAGVDPALVHHYFDDKADLFTATLEAPLRPDRALDVILAGSRDDVGERLVGYLLERLDDEKSSRRMVVILRTALSSGPGTRMVREFLLREVLSKLAGLVGGEDAQLRAELAASQLVGLMMTRYALRVEPIAGAPRDELARRVGAVVQWHLFGTVGGQPVAAPADADEPRDAHEPLDAEGASGE